MKQSDRFGKIAEVMTLDKFEKGVQLYIREVFEVEGDITDRALLITEKLGINNSIISEAEQFDIADKLQIMLEMYDNEKPIDMRSVDFFKWDTLAEAVKKPTKIDMKNFKWTDSSGAERVLNEGPADINNRKTVRIDEKNKIQFSNHWAFVEGQKLSLAEVKRLKEQGLLVIGG